jgi:hypothetical protein
MVRIAMLWFTAFLAAATLAAQSQSQKSFGVAGMEQLQGPSQSPPGPQTNSAGEAPKLRTFVLSAPGKSGKRSFEDVTTKAEAGSNAPAVSVLGSADVPPCPVSLRAVHRSGGGVITTGETAPAGAAQHIRLILDKILS